MIKPTICLFAALSLAACASAPPQDGAAPGAGLAKVDGSPSIAVTPPSSVTPAVAPAATNIGDPKNLLAKRDIYFGFDSFAIDDDYRSLIEAHGHFLQGKPNARLTVEGNTDERGSREYNIALGQERAVAAKRILVLMGATDGQIETVSFGKEKPRNGGHDESAWAENRRDSLQYQR